MHIWQNRHHKTSRTGTFAVRNAGTIAVEAGLLLLLLSGCASPGPPLPPSLKLPEVVSATGLTAARVGNQVTLHWTTPTRTTDKLDIKGAITAEICRNTPAVAPPPPARNAQRPRGTTITLPCAPVTRVTVTPGASEAVDILPEALAAGSARLLAYRVQLLNSAGRTVGPSPPVFAAAGTPPRTVEAFQGKSTKAGVVLEWQPDSLEKQDADSSSAAIELDRTTVAPPAAASTPERKSILPGASGFAGTKEPLESHFRAGAASLGARDPGGTIDRTAQIGHTYNYTAQRVHTVTLGGQALEIRSAPSAEVTVPVRDAFPPDAPTGLVTVPGFAGEQAATPTIDLSWEPNDEPRIAGYRVYRRDASSDAASAWQQLTSELVMVAAYRDVTVAAGHKYSYRVTAVSTAGLESAPSPEIVETAAAQ